jgi:bacteriorhodopsin
MKLSKTQITSPETDSMLVLGLAIFCLILAVIPPYGHRAAYFGCGAAANFISCWLMRRKIAAAKKSQSHSDS